MYGYGNRTRIRKPYNPNLASAFYLAGFIESWGRGIEKMRDALKEDGFPVLSYTIHPGDIVVKFTAPEDRVVRVTDKVTDKVTDRLDSNSVKQSANVFYPVLQKPTRNSIRDSKLVRLLTQAEKNRAGVTSRCDTRICGQWAKDNLARSLGV